MEKTTLAHKPEAKKSRWQPSTHSRVRRHGSQSSCSGCGACHRIARSTSTNTNASASLMLKSLDPGKKICAIRFLQRTYGNRYVQRLIQTKLSVGRPGDVYEQEADRVADTVMRMPEPQIRRQPEEEEEELQAKAATCSTPTPDVTPDLETSLNAHRGGGQPLPETDRGFMERRFGSDFSGVRVHTDSNAVQTSRELNAEAFTYGSNIYFGAGRYSPGTSSGKRLLAHELTHVVQQNRISTNQTRTNLIQRKVRPNYVSCNKYPRTYPIFKAIGTTDPVGVIKAADTRVIELLDDVIGELKYSRSRILAGEPTAWPTVSDVVAKALNDRFGINPNNRAVWTGKGYGTVFVLIKRFQAARKILNGGWIRYTCLAPSTLNTPTCGGSCCGSNTDACSCSGVSRIFLCRRFWRSGKDAQAGTLLHEAIHIYFAFIGDTGRWGNAHCYEQFVYDLNDISVSTGCS